jgi:hypothetical protein
VLLKPAKTRAIVGIALAILIPILAFTGLALYGGKLKEEETRDLAAADAAYEAKRWSEAKPLYEKHRNASSAEVKAKCRARLGRIAYEDGDREAARLEFEAAWDAKNDYVFAVDDPEIAKLWRRTVNRKKRDAGSLTFETVVSGSKKDEVTISAWRVEGKRASFDIVFKSDPKTLKTNVVFYDEAERSLKEVTWDAKADDRIQKKTRFITPDFDGDWDDVRKAVVYVEPR